MKKFFTLVAMISVSWGVNAATLNAADLAASNAQIVTLEKVVPDYPNAQLVDKRSGNVILAYDLDKQGKPINITLVENSGPKQFVHTSMRALKRSSFEPVVLNAQTVSVEGLYLQYDYYIEAATNTSITDLVALSR